MQLVILTGRSGSGKTIALRALEDLGYYCIDNLPIAFLLTLNEHLKDLPEKVAISIDARNIPKEPLSLEKILTTLEKLTTVEVLYLIAEDSILLKRFNETRRKHPLTDQQVSLREAIAQENLILAPLVNHANMTIDTSHLSHQELSQLLREKLLKTPENSSLILLQSFGFKYGLPQDSDFVFDVRSLPNPYWEKALTKLSGLDQPVIDYLENATMTQELLVDLTGFIQKWIPVIQQNNRSYINLSVGCTGGKHRSVFMVEKMAAALKGSLSNVQVRHRDLTRI